MIKITEPGSFRPVSPASPGKIRKTGFPRKSAFPGKTGRTASTGSPERALPQIRTERGREGKRTRRQRPGSPRRRKLVRIRGSGPGKDPEKTQNRQRKGTERMNQYKRLSDDHQKRVSAFLDKYALFACNDKQFQEGLQRLGISREDAGRKLVRMGGTGGFMLKDRSGEYNTLAETIAAETDAAVHDPVNGPGFAYDMFYYELANHEYSYTGRAEDALDALGYTWEDVQKDEILKAALKRAAEDVMRDSV